MDNGKRVALYSVAVNVALTIVKGWLALISGSTAVLSEALHSLTDVVGSLSVWIGIKISRVRSPQFPWGLYKVENIAAVISALFIFLIAYEVAKDAFTSEAKEVVNIGRSIVTLGFLMVPVLLFAQYERKKAKELNSPSLLADARHWVTDIISIGVVICGLAASPYFPFADKISALIVIIIVLKVGFEILRDSIKSLLDASVDKETLKSIRDTVAGFEEVSEIRALNARNSGSFIFVHADIRLSSTRLKEAHKVADSIEEAVKEAVPFIERVSIHYEPIKKELTRYAAPLANKEGNISPHFGSAPFVAFWDKRLSDDVIVNEEIIENPFLKTEKGKGIKVAELIVDKKVDIVYIKESFSGKGPEYLFSDAGVEVSKTDLKKLSQLKEK
ncbi:MAG: cation diffusion facilitator family transporter [Proteobacteria bacterium]|nr:cation diffusion facilitator family transporter [Pseudomonadota bacterium]